MPESTPTLADLGLTKKQSSSWQQLAKVDEDKFEHALESIDNSISTKQIIKSATNGVHVGNNSGNDEWYTPQEFIESARLAMHGIDTDPASCEVGQNNVKAETYYTQDTDGLAQKWRGNVWLNPPYSKDLIKLFTQAVCIKYKENEIVQACVLVNNATETAWGQGLLSTASAVCFISRRIKYLDSTGVPQNTGLQGQMVCYLGGEPEQFGDVFTKHGIVLYV